MDIGGYHAAVQNGGAVPGEGMQRRREGVPWGRSISVLVYTVMKWRCAVFERCVVVAVMIALALAPGVSRAGDAPGCEGLTQFRADVMPIGEAWADALFDAHLDPSRSPATFSSDDWLAYADIMLAANRGLKTIDAPDWLEEWLQVRIESTGLTEQMSQAAAEGGFLVLLAFKDQVDALDQRSDDVDSAANAQCPDFAQFAREWDALDGEIDGTPVATPAS